MQFYLICNSRLNTTLKHGDVHALDISYFIIVNSMRHFVSLLSKIQCRIHYTANASTVTDLAIKILFLGYKFH
jgi:hypothetical protein